MSSSGIHVGPDHKPLPSLPLPPLEESIDKFLKAARLHLTESEQAELQKLAADFLQKEGPLLHSELADRAAASSTSWLLDWWTDQAYLAYPESLPIWSNFYCQFHPTSPSPLPSPLPPSLPLSPQALRAGVWAAELLAFRDDLLSDRLPPSPLSLRLLNNAFNSCRIPALPSDAIHRLPRPHDQRAAPRADFVVVMRADRFFILRHLGGGPHGGVAPWQAIARGLQAVLDHPLDAEKAPGEGFLPLSWLTAAHRHDWAKMRQRLLHGSRRNAALLRAIEDCAFVVCLDGQEPSCLDASDAALFHNGGANRWFDKPVQLVAFPSGEGGANCEHSGWDGTTAVPIFERMLQRERRLLRAGPLDLLYHADAAAAAPPPLLEGPFALEAPAYLRQELAELRAATLRALGSERHASAAVRGYGKGLLKRCGLSPDAVCQLAFQLAFFRAHARFPPVYESASTRRFQWGRTETLRPVSEASVALVRALAAGGGAEQGRLAGLLREAAKEHSRRAQEAAQQARGFDRHLFGLRQVAKLWRKGEVPALFAHPAFGKLSYWSMSTSNISTDLFEVGWGAVVQDGYGICYCIREDEIRLKISSQSDTPLPAPEFAKALVDAFDELSKAFEPKSNL